MNMMAEIIRGKGRSKPDGTKSNGSAAESPREVGPAVVREAPAVRVSGLIRYSGRHTFLRDEVHDHSGQCDAETLLVQSWSIQRRIDETTQGEEDRGVYTPVSSTRVRAISWHLIGGKETIKTIPERRRRCAKKGKDG